jgi:hypothetical protein
MKLDTEKTEIASNITTTQISELIVDLEEQASRFATEISELIVNLDSKVSVIEEKHKGVIPDASTREGYETCKAIRKEVMPTKTALEKARVTLKDPITKAGKFVDQSFNPLIERALAVYKPFVDAYQAVDRENQRLEDERLLKVTEGLYYISNIGMSCIGKSSIVVAATIEEFEVYEIDSKVFRDKTDEATQAFQKSMGIMSDMYAQTVRQEEMDVKEAEMIAQQAARESEWKEQQAARQAEMDAKEAEMLAKEEAFNKKTEEAFNKQNEELQVLEKHREHLAKLARDKSQEPILTTEDGNGLDRNPDIAHILKPHMKLINEDFESKLLLSLQEQNSNKWEKDIWYELAVFSNQVGLSKNDQVLLTDIVKRHVK